VEGSPFPEAGAWVAALGSTRSGFGSAGRSRAARGARDGGMAEAASGGRRSATAGREGAGGAGSTARSAGRRRLAMRARRAPDAGGGSGASGRAGSPVRRRLAMRARRAPEGGTGSAGGVSGRRRAAIALRGRARASSSEGRSSARIRAGALAIFRPPWARGRPSRWPDGSRSSSRKPRRCCRTSGPASRRACFLARRRAKRL